MTVTYRSQSTAMMIVTSSAGKPTVSSTMTIVIKPACGMPAAPIEAAVAVTLIHIHPINRWHRKVIHLITHLTATMCPNVSDMLRN